MKTSIAQLEDHFRRLAQIEHALTFLHWDQLVMMPPGGNASRSEAIAELTAMHHAMLVSEDIGELLEQAKDQPATVEQRRSLLEMAREYQWAVCLPTDLVKAKSLAGSHCEHAWRQQRTDNDWPGFLKNFTAVVELSRQEAQARQAAAAGRFDSPYDALLDLYCTGDSSAMINNLFNVLKRELPPLIDQVIEKQRGWPANAPGNFPESQQIELNVELMRCLGFDFDCGRLDQSSHPFSTGDRGDHRITTRFRSDEFLEALRATAHETGHAAYESGLPAELAGLPAGQARNLCLHESQSLLFEKQVFLSRAFIDYFTPIIHAFLPDTTRYDSTSLRRICTQVERDLIRVEADELTYPLHVILRFEIERDLINQTLAPSDIPEAWDEKMRTYLGLTTKGNYRDGCLQDIHWTDGSFGYFPAYTVGALNGAQIFSAYSRDLPDWQDQLRRGDLSILRQWLSEKIWSKGSLLESQELITEATGSPTDPRYFLRYLKDRYIEERH